MAPPHPYDEVVIDGDTSTDDDEGPVVVVPPQSRKRRRQSTILDEDDEREPEPMRASTTPAPLSTGQSARAQPQRAAHDSGDDDDDESIEIIQISTPSSSEGKRKSRRLTIMESDEESEPHVETRRTISYRDEKEEIDDERSSRTSPSGRGVMNRLAVEPVRRSSLSQGPHFSRTPPSEAGSNRRASTSSNSSRRSSRIEHKRQEKEKNGPRGRKLDFLSLDNCLDHTSGRRSLARDNDDDDFIVDDEDEEYVDDEEEEEEEVEEVEPPPRKRARQSGRERVYADGDDDLDDFIAGDDEVEYMDDDDEGVMDQASSADELDPREDEENIRIAMQSREPSEWFSIYMRYLEECILDEDLDNKIRRASGKLEYQLFKQSIHHIERAICSRRDAIRSSVVWNDDIMESLHCATRFHSIRCNATTDCQACRRINHFATQLVQFGGFACDATQLYKENWMKRLREAVDEMEPIRSSFEMGSVCHARTLGFWQLLHAKHFWVALVDAKRRECDDGTGRIVDSERKPFYKAEYGRYKRLLAIVDKFSTEVTQSYGYMPNVWKKVTPTHIESEFLRGSREVNEDSEAPRRGTMESLASESDESGDEDEGDEEVEVDDPRQRSFDSDRRNASPMNSREQNITEIDSPEHSRRSMTPQKKMRQSSIMSSFGSQAPNKMSPQSEQQKADAPGSIKPGGDAKLSANDPDSENLLCLVCGQNQRDGAIAHGNYLHFYSCFRCAKRQHASNHGCMVCDRPIDQVFRILPLSPEARAEIIKQQTTS